MAVHDSCGGVLLPDHDGIDSRAENAYPCECPECPICGDRINPTTAVDLYEYPLADGSQPQAHPDCRDNAAERQGMRRAAEAANQ